MGKLHGVAICCGKYLGNCRLAVLRSCLMLLLLLAVAPVAAQQTATEEETVWAIREKYAKQLGVPADSLQYVPLYQMLDRWPAFAETNPEKLGNQPQGVFAQFIYYLAFSTKIPAQLEQTYVNEKTYLFKNPVYLQTGDLLFFGKNAARPDQLAIYLQNNILVYAAADGKLVYVPLQQLQKQYALTGAKIVKDNQ